MMRCRAVLPYGLPMVFGGIAHIVIPAVLGIFLCQLTHTVIAVSLSKYAGCRDAHIGGIPLDNGVGRYILIGRPSVTIYKNVLRPDLQLIQRPVHGKYAAPQDIHLVNLLRRALCDSPRYSLMLNDFSKEVAPAFGQLLGIIKQFVAEIRRQYHSCRKDRTREATATCFVAACLDESGCMESF